MRIPIAFSLLASVAAPSAAQEPASDTDATIFSNVEEVYFDNNAGDPAAPELVIRKTAGEYVFIDAFGDPVSRPDDAEIIEELDEFLIVKIGDTVTVLRKANPITCWVALKKKAPKPDGSEDWVFTRDLKSHDQGGRFRVGGEDGTPETVVRMRSVRWPAPSTNRPTRVLYIHEPDDPVRAVSYSWANIDASRVGINLRWVQASCTIDGRERSAKQTADSFKP